MKRQYLVRIKLKTNDIWQVESRVNEVRAIKEWIEERCDWNQDLFEVRIHMSGSVMDVWFENETDAMWCKLRWL